MKPQGRAAPPSDLAPMLAGGTGFPARTSGHQFEPKWDGVRTIATVGPEGLTLVGRNGRDSTRSYPEVASLVDAVAGRWAVLDGEVVTLGPEGQPSFQRLQRRMHNAAPTPRLLAEFPVILVAFDVLWLDGELLTGRPQRERRQVLESLGLAGPHLSTSPLLSGTPDELLAACRDIRLEGYMAKRLDATYEVGRRSAAWSKIKCGRRREFVVGGWTPGKGNRGGSIGSLALGAFDLTAGVAAGLSRPPRLLYVGQAGSGLSADDLDQLARVFERLAVPRSPFVAVPRGLRLSFVEPVLVAEVAYSEVTEAGTLRQPSIQGFRTDVAAADVTLDEELALRHIPGPP